MASSADPTPVVDPERKQRRLPSLSLNFQRQVQDLRRQKHPATPKGVATTALETPTTAVSGAQQQGTPQSVGVGSAASSRGTKAVAPRRGGAAGIAAAVVAALAPSSFSSAPRRKPQTVKRTVATRWVMASNGSALRRLLLSGGLQRDGALGEPRASIGAAGAGILVVQRSAPHLGPSAAKRQRLLLGSSVVRKLGSVRRLPSDEKLLVARRRLRLVPGGGGALKTPRSEAPLRQRRAALLVPQVREVAQSAKCITSQKGSSGEQAEPAEGGTLSAATGKLSRRGAEADPRGRNILGKLIGHLAAAKHQLVDEMADDRHRGAALVKASAEVAKQQPLSEEEDLEVLADDHDRAQEGDEECEEANSEVERQIHEKEMVSLQRRLEAHYELMKNFIRTRSEPTIFYLPVKHTPQTEEYLKQTQAAIQQKISSLEAHLQSMPGDLELEDVEESDDDDEAADDAT